MVHTEKSYMSLEVYITTYKMFTQIQYNDLVAHEDWQFTQA